MTGRFRNCWRGEKGVSETGEGKRKERIHHSSQEIKRMGGLIV